MGSCRLWTGSWVFSHEYRVRDREDTEQGDVDQEPRADVIVELGVKVDVVRQERRKHRVRLGEIYHESSRG